MSAGQQPRRRVRRALAGVTLAMVAAWSGVVLLGATASDATAGPTMTFKGSLNLLGVLNGLNVSPSSVSVPANGRVTFVNGATVPLTLTVGGRSQAMAAGQQVTYTFPGRAQPQRLFAQATAVNVPLVGTLTSSSGTVNVAALPAAPPPAAKPKPPAQPANPPPPPAAPRRAAPPASGVGQPDAVGDVRTPDRGSDPDARAAAGDEPTARDRMAGGQQQPGEAQKPVDEAGLPGALADPVRTPETVNEADSIFAPSGGQLGLLILVGTILLAGVGTAAVRTVLAQRPATVGAHRRRGAHRY